MPRADVVIVILLRALDYPASAGHASGRKSLALVDGGPGDLSADGAFGIHDTGPAWALAALGAGAAASALAIELGRAPVAQDAASEPDPRVVDEAVSREEFAAQASR